MKSLFKIFSSLRLTVVCLIFAVLLVFFGTLAQVDEGLYLAQARWFRSFLVWWGPESAGWKIPIFPGGYLVGGVLLTNLITAHIARFKISWKKLGINVTHAGIILLLVGQLATDLLSHETQMRFAEGENKNFSESSLRNELVFTTDSGKPNEEEVISIPESIVKTEKEIRHEKLPFVVRVKDYYSNADLRQRGPMVDTGEPPATRGVGPNVVLNPLAETHSMDSRNMPAAVIDVSGPQGSLGTWLVSTFLNPQEIKIGDRTWRVGLRWERQYLPFKMQLLKATHEVYTGTEIPKNYQSRVRIENPQRSENREVDIYMNNPLRYEGLTFYQYQMGRAEMGTTEAGSSTLQVVKNPSWLTPYIGCVMVGAGMLIQFLMHLIGFISKRRIA
jgi:hypothetical protein